jgi:hypothetical protein
LDAPPVYERELLVPLAIAFVRFTDEDIPFTEDVIVAPFNVKLLELIIEDVEIDPAILDVIVFAEDVNVFGTDKLVNVAFVAVILFVFIVLAVNVFVAVMFPDVKFDPVAFVKKRFVKYPVTAEIRLVNMLPVLFMFCVVVVPFNFTPFNSEIDVVAITPFTVDVS